MVNKNPIYENLDQYDNLVDADVMLSLENKYAPLIGEFVTSFSLLEHMLDMQVSKIINNRSDLLGYAVIKNLTYAQKVEILDSLCKLLVVHAIKNKEKKKRSLELLISELKSIARFRNDIVHANWYSLDKNRYVRIKKEVDKGNGGIKIKKVRISEKSIRDGVKKIFKLFENLANISKITH